MDKNKLHEDLASFQEILQQFFGVGYKYLDALFRQYFEEATQEKFDDNISFVECVHIYTNQQVGK
jgi:abortive infection bacteriophage resistance protein